MQLTLSREGKSVQLASEIGRGGEGAVFEIAGRPSQVAKIYSAPPDEPKVRKLDAMVQSASPEICRVAAWPNDLLLDGKGKLRGFVMPRVSARRQIHELYSPKSRFDAFPDVDFRFIVHVSINIARAFAVLHAQGHVIGDVNHGNLLVAPNGTVTLIDCDSFQVKVGSHLFTCDVGTALFTPPELYGHPFRGLQRTPNHDAFGLAILVFHLLYVGRHPFAGRFLGQGDMPIERAIAENRFAYGPASRSYMMERPPGTIRLDAMGRPVAARFTEAFSPQNNGNRRPDAVTWMQTLEILRAELIKCGTSNAHYYARSQPACPWCELENRSGVRLFGQRATALPRGTPVDVESLWQAIVSVPPPPPDPQLPSNRLWTPPPGVNLPSAAGKHARVALSIVLAILSLSACTVLSKQTGGIIPGLILAVISLLIWPWVPAGRRAAVNNALAAARAGWATALAKWEREASQRVFSAKLEQLQRLRRDLIALPNERKKRLARLDAEREEKQLQRYLDRFRIDKASIDGIGPGRTAMLASFGIETAADVDRFQIMRIQGFGEVLTSQLTKWKAGHIQRFKFNPSEPIDPRDIAALDHELGTRSKKMVMELQDGQRTLARLSQEIVAARRRLMPQIEGAWLSLKVAEAQLKAI